MFGWLDKILDRIGWTGLIDKLLRYSARVLLVVGLCFIIFFIAKRLVAAIFYRIPFVRKSTLAGIVKKSRLIPRTMHLITPLILRLSASGFGSAAPWIVKAATVYSIIVIMFVTDSLLDIVDDLYRRKEIAKRRPIKGLLQVAELVIAIVLGIVIIASLFGARVEQRDDNPPWVRSFPTEDEFLSFLDRDPHDFSQGVCPQVTERYRFFRDVLRHYPVLGEAVRIVLPDLQGPWIP